MSIFQFNTNIDIWFHLHSALNIWGVNCGGNRKAVSCEQCPQGQGMAGCKGECMWHRNACIKKGILSRLKIRLRHFKI